MLGHDINICYVGTYEIYVRTYEILAVDIGLMRYILGLMGYMLGLMRYMLRLMRYRTCGIYLPWNRHSDNLVSFFLWDCFHKFVGFKKHLARSIFFY